MLTHVADGIWVRQSEWVWTNSIVVCGEDGLVPGWSAVAVREAIDSGVGWQEVPWGIRAIVTFRSETACTSSYEGSGMPDACLAADAERLRWLSGPLRGAVAGRLPFTCRCSPCSKANPPSCSALDRTGTALGPPVRAWDHADRRIGSQRDRKQKGRPRLEWLVIGTAERPQTPETSSESQPELLPRLGSSYCRP
jgi:hypothetical protein